MIQAFNDIMKQTEWTKQCLTLNLESESEGFYTKQLSQLKQSQESMQEVMNKQFEEDDVTDTELVTFSVDAKMMNLKWMERDGKTFLNLVQILD